jgi:hypothetical protein
MLLANVSPARPEWTWNLQFLISTGAFWAVAKAGPGGARKFLFSRLSKEEFEYE